MPFAKAWRVYTNLKLFAQYNALNVKKTYTKEEFEKEMRNNDFLVMDCTVSAPHDKAKNISLAILLTNEESSIANKKQDFVNAMKTVLKHDEIMLVSNKPIASHIRKYANEEKMPLYAYEYTVFVIDMTRAPNATKDRILSHEEAKKILTELHLHPKSLPRLGIDSPTAIWLRAKPGDVVESEIFSEETGLTTYYRLVDVIHS